MRRLLNVLDPGQCQGRLFGQLAKEMAKASICLFTPCWDEPFGLVAAEAMACGLPVVAADATGSSSLVAHGESGMLVQPGDVKGFADALAPYCLDADLRARHGAAGLERSQPYTWEAINASMVDTYLRLVEAKPPCECSA